MTPPKSAIQTTAAKHTVNCVCVCVCTYECVLEIDGQRILVHFCDPSVSGLFIDSSAESNLSADCSPVPTYLLSPDIDTQDSGYSKDGGFYLLRKDSERRSTLVHILSQDMDKVCYLCCVCPYKLQPSLQAIILIACVCVCVCVWSWCNSGWSKAFSLCTFFCWHVSW